MKDPLPSFIRLAKKICLTTEEKAYTAHLIGLRVSEEGSKRLPSMTSTVILKKMKAVSLSPREKAISREWLMSAIEKKSQERWWLHPIKHLTSITAGVLIIAISSGTLSFAAESTVPGDMLYPIKVNVNEVVRDRVHMNEEGKTLWEMQKAERRLREAEIMTNRDALTPEQEAEIQERFRVHAEAVKSRIASLDAPMATKMGQTFEATLRAHGNMFRRMHVRHPEKAGQMMNLLADVQKERMNIEENLIARDAVGDALDTPDATKENIIARKELRRRIEAELMAELPPASEKTLIDSAPRTMMMKVDAIIEEDGEKKIPAQTDEDGELERDMAFSVEARMNVTKRRLRDMKDLVEQSNSSLPNDIEVRMMGAEQILDVARSQMEEGNMEDALRASNMALRHAEKARNEGEKRMREVMNNEK